MKHKFLAYIGVMLFFLGFLLGCGSASISMPGLNPAQNRKPSERGTVVKAESGTKSKEIAFETDYRFARELAILENKPMLLFFTAPKCVYSQQMLEETFRNEDVLHFADHFVCVLIDESRNRELCKEFDVKGTPTVQFLTPQGTYLQRLTAKKTSEQLLLQMQVAIQSLVASEKMKSNL